jgi:hypothetical protein
VSFSVRRIASVVLLTTVPVVAAALPANAALVGFAGGATIGCGWRGDQTCDGAGQALPGIGLGGSEITVTCTAATPYDVQVTGVGCYILGDQTNDVHWATPAWTQKLVSTTSATFTAGLTSTSYQLCVGAGVIDDLGITHGIGGYNCFRPV